MVAKSLKCIIELKQKQKQGEKVCLNFKIINTF